jgi:NADPH-dependent curcumin reductase CurA
VYSAIRPQTTILEDTFMARSLPVEHDHSLHPDTVDYRESVVHGIDNGPKGLIALLKGENFGKQLVRLA